jgi:AcrR family transcriptional regulator
MGISPGNLHYHYDNREEIIRMLYIQMRDQLKLPIAELPQTIAELVEHQKLILTVSWKYRFFNKELLCLLSRDKELNDIYVKDNIAHRSRIMKVIQNLIDHGELDIKYDNIIEYIAETILLTIQFWNPFMITLGKTPNKETLQAGIQRSNEVMRPYLTKQALKTLAKLEQ